MMEDGRKYNVIALRNVPLTWSHAKVAKALTTRLPGHFTVVGFETERPPKSKMAFVQLSRHLDLDTALRKTARVSCDGVTLYGFLPQFVPKPIRTTKTVTTVEKRRKTKNHHPDKVFAAAVRELLIELQYKYSPLYEMSEDTNHKLLDRLSEIICDRLMLVMNGLVRPHAHMVTKMYRRVHPHDEDFKLVESTLRRVEDELEIPRTPAVEQDLLSAAPHLSETWKMVQARNKYLEIVTEKVVTHLNDMDVDLPGDTEGQRATIEVRQGLKKIAPYIDEVLKLGFPTRTLLPIDQINALPIRMYCEPALPPWDDRFLCKFKIDSTHRIRNIHNCVKFTVPFKHYSHLMRYNKHDGETKYIIRSDEERPLYIISEENTPALMSRIRAMFSDECGDDKSDYETLDSDMEAELCREF